VLRGIEGTLRSGLSVAVAAILAALASICFIEVVRRPFGGSFVWYDEFVGYLLVWLTLLGAALARSQHQHIGVDNLLDKLSPKTRRGVTLSSHIVMVLVHVVLFVYGSQLVTRFLSERAITVDIPIGYVYAIIPLSAILMLAIEAIHIARWFRHDGSTH